MAGLFDGSALERPVTCPRCGADGPACTCPKDAAGGTADLSAMPVRVRREKRRGKWTTVVYDLAVADSDRKAALKTLKGRCSAGGKATADGFELQGDHRDTVIVWLKDAGYKSTKAAGG